MPAILIAAGLLAWASAIWQFAQVAFWVFLVLCLALFVYTRRGKCRFIDAIERFIRRQ